MGIFQTIEEEDDEDSNIRCGESSIQRIDVN